MLCTLNPTGLLQTPLLRYVLCAMSVMPVIRDAFSQQAADTTQWTDNIDWTVHCDWLQVASSPHNTIYTQYYANEVCKTYASLAGFLASFIVL